MRPEIPALPDLARSILKGAIVTLASSGLITSADAEMLVTVLRLGDA